MRLHGRRSRSGRLGSVPHNTETGAVFAMTTTGLKPQKIVSDEDYKKAASEINAEMETFSREHRAYVGECKEAASQAHCG